MFFFHLIKLPDCFITNSFHLMILLHVYQNITLHYMHTKPKAEIFLFLGHVPKND